MSRKSLEVYAVEIGFIGETREAVSTTVKVKDDPTPPCWGIGYDEWTTNERRQIREAWALVRGKQMILGRVIPRKLINYGSQCDSDVFWEVLSEELKQSTDEILGNSGDFDGAIICRHMLDIGD